MSVEFSSRHFRSSLTQGSDRGGLTDLFPRVLALVFALLIGALVGLITFGCFKLIAAMSALWAPELPQDLMAIEWRYSIALGITLLVSAFIAGQLLQTIEGGRPHGPADLIHAA